MYLYCDGSKKMLQTIHDRLVKFRTYVEADVPEKQFLETCEKFPTYTDKIGFHLAGTGSPFLLYWDVRYRNEGMLPLKIESENLSMRERILSCMVKATKNIFKPSEKSSGCMMMLVDSSDASWYKDQLQKHLQDQAVLDLVASCISGQRSQIATYERLHFIGACRTADKVLFASCFNHVLHIEEKATLLDNLKGTKVPPSILQALTKHLTTCGVSNLKITGTLEFYTKQNILMDLLEAQPFMAVIRGLVHIQDEKLWNEQGTLIKAHIAAAKPDVATLFDPPMDPLTGGMTEGMSKVLPWYKKYALMEAGRAHLSAKCLEMQEEWKQLISKPDWNKEDAWKQLHQEYTQARNLYVDLLKKMRKGLADLPLEDRASIRVATYHKGFGIETVDDEGDQQMVATFSSYMGGLMYKSPARLIIPPLPGDEAEEESKARLKRLMDGFLPRDRPLEDIRRAFRKVMVDRGKEYGFSSTESLEGLQVAKPEKSPKPKKSSRSTESPKSKKSSKSTESPMETAKGKGTKRKLFNADEEGMEKETEEVSLDKRPKKKKTASEARAARLEQTGGTTKKGQAEYLANQVAHERAFERKQSDSLTKKNPLIDQA